jgi:hypothetical protein
MRIEDLDTATEGDKILDQLHEALYDYVVLPSTEAGDAVVLWIAATHAQAAWQHATRLVVNSPMKRCGKSRLLDIVEATCHRPLITVNISPAALVRSVGDDPPTILLDEADTVFGKKSAENNEDLRGILNAGHQRNRPYIRWDATTRQQENCPTFAMAALAGIGDLPDTITDRAVNIAMRRRAPGETVFPFRHKRDTPRLHQIRDALAEWTTTITENLTEAEPDMPVEDRAADTWESLVAVADAAGSDWPNRARQACKLISGEADENDVERSVSLRLLADFRQIFGDLDRLSTAAALDRLHRIADAPWSDWYGKPISATKVAEMLRPYAVRPKLVKIDGETARGYRRDDLHDAWARYLPLPPTTPVTPQVTASPEVTG